MKTSFDPQTGKPITVFDIGMFDGEDTAYYLESGYRVIAVEANPGLVSVAQERFKDAIASGQLTCVNAAISPTGEEVELTLTGTDLASSTLFDARVAHKLPFASIRVPGITLTDLFDRFGVPRYLKVDIEGADRLCILSLTPVTRPAFISFEVGDDAEELITHAENVGYTRFKIINQNYFRELANQNALYDRAVRRLMHRLGYLEPRKIKRAGRFFTADFSSGPVPWLSDGKWYSARETRERLRSAIEKQLLEGWYDIHAALPES